MKNNSLSFKGINISGTSVFGHRMEIYKLTPKDAPFLAALKKNVDLRKLYPRMDRDSLSIYDAILKSSINRASEKNKHSMLLTCDSKPCGIMVSTLKNSAHFVDYVCTWPVAQETKAPFGAQLLFEQLYKNFLKTNACFIELCATRFGDAVAKYGKVGFLSKGGDNFTEIMGITRNRVEEFHHRLYERMMLVPKKGTEDIDLFEVTTIENKKRK